jgi:hypothetical protein
MGKCVFNSIWVSAEYFKELCVVNLVGISILVDLNGAIM